MQPTPALQSVCIVLIGPVISPRALRLLVGQNLAVIGGLDMPHLSGTLWAAPGCGVASAEAQVALLALSWHLQRATSYPT